MSRIAIMLVVVGLTLGCSKAPSPEPSVLRLPAIGAETSCDLKIGERFPKIEAIDIDEQNRVLNESLYGERLTLIVFWSTWCGFCMDELPHEIALSRTYEDRGLRVIGVNADVDARTARSAAEATGVPWLNLYEGEQRRISSQLGVEAWPALFLLDSEGRIIATDDFLRNTTVRVLEGGEHVATLRLDWTLEELLNGPKR